MNRLSRALQSPKYLKKKRRRTAITVILFVLCLIAIIIAIVYVLRSPFLQISSINIKGVTTLNSEEIKGKVLEVLSGDYFSIIPRTSVLFYPKKSIKNILFESYKQIEKIDINRKDVSNLEINIMEYKPIALVCEGFYEDNVDDSNCFLVNKDGYVFAKSVSSSVSLFHYYIETDKGDDIIGLNFIDSNRFKELQKFIENISNSGIPILGMLINENGAYELYAKNKDNSEAIIYFDDRSSLRKTSSNLIAFWNDSQIIKKGATTALMFDYINLRFGNNIFYVTK
ncbi:MAG: hypothetical protein AAB637_01325 [Patescibacteria group bacterium]